MSLSFVLNTHRHTRARVCVCVCLCEKTNRPVRDTLKKQMSSPHHIS